MSAFAAADISAINASGPVAFEASGYVASLQAGITSSEPAKANEALEAFAALCEGSAEWVEPYLLSLLPVILDNFANPKTSESATHAGDAIAKKMNSHSMKLVLDLLYESFSSMKWQTKKGALVLLGSLGKIHEKVVQTNLPYIILKLIDVASDVKKEVKEQTKICFAEICATITNVDIVPIIPRVINAYMEPVKLTENALDALIGTTFINDVDVPTLALLVPILTKGMRERAVKLKRQSALVIGNMCKVRSLFTFELAFLFL